MPTPITNEEYAAAIREIMELVSSDATDHAEMIYSGLKNATDEEKNMANIIFRIHKIAHPLTCDACSHKRKTLTPKTCTQ